MSYTCCRVLGTHVWEIDDLDHDTVLRLIASAIAYRAGHLSAQDSHREQAEAVLTALQHNGYLQ